MFASRVGVKSARPSELTENVDERTRGRRSAAEHLNSSERFQAASVFCSSAVQTQHVETCLITHKLQQCVRPECVRNIGNRVPSKCFTRWLHPQCDDHYYILLLEHSADNYPENTQSIQYLSSNNRHIN